MVTGTFPPQIVRPVCHMFRSIKHCQLVCQSNGVSSWLILKEYKWISWLSVRQSLLSLIDGQSTPIQWNAWGWAIIRLAIMPLHDPYFDARLPHFSGRHNPHPNRVTHFKGLLDLPVRIVRDPPLSQPQLPPPVGDGYPNYVSPHMRLGQKSHSSWDLTQSATVPTGLSPNMYMQWQVALPEDRLGPNSDNESDKVSHLAQYGVGPSNLRMPVGFLNLARPRVRVPNNDLINGLQYFTGLRNYSVRGRPNLGSLIATDARHAQYGHARQMQSWPAAVERERWKQELAYMTGTILGKRPEWIVFYYWNNQPVVLTRFRVWNLVIRRSLKFSSASGSYSSWYTHQNSSRDKGANWSPWSTSVIWLSKIA